jgi:dolichyl-phosphate-mannose-protein mannosyltransferase
MRRSTIASDIERDRTAPAGAGLQSGLMDRIIARMPLLFGARRIGFAQAAVVVALVASINFLANLGNPPAPIWDESYYLTAAVRYEEHIAQFASHPPLGLQLIAAGDVLLHPNERLATRHIGWDKKIAGDKLPKGYSFAGLRLMPGIFGVLGAVTFFALMYVLTQSVLAALAFSNLYVFDNALIVHFRAAQLDPFQITFVLGALLCFAVSARRGGRSSPAIDALYGLSVGFACMAKLNASVLAFLGVMLIARRIGIGWRTVPRLKLLLAAARDGLVMAGGCFAAIALIATLHVVLNPVPPVASSPAGRKDLGFVTPVYAAYLHRERPFSPAVVLDASQDYLHFMFEDLKGVPRTDPNGSKPFMWPLGRGTINYRWDSTGERTAYVQLADNPVGWYLGLVALIASAWLVLDWSWQTLRRTGRMQQAVPPARRTRHSAAHSAARAAGRLTGRAAAHSAAPSGRRTDGPISGSPSDPARRALIVMLLAQWLLYMAVHAYIGIERVMYLYHYFIALMMAYCLVPLVFAEAAERWPALRERQAPVLAGMAALLWAAFIFYAPLTFHWYLTFGQCQWRDVLQHVIACHR